MQLGDVQIDLPLFLAPMAGVTDRAFREICAEAGAGVTVTEMVSSRALVYQDKKSAALLGRNDGCVCGAQIFGNDPSVMAQAARIAAEISHCDFLDINMGCPMPKIANFGDGCGLMRTTELAGQIVRAVKNAVDIPVTIKCRLGWDKGSINVLDFTKCMEQNGADLVTVHARTRSMLYSGAADWDAIAAVKQQLHIPVIANGDIVDAASALKCLRWTGADGLMIGRAAFGDPWVFSQVKAAMQGEPVEPRPPLAQRMAVALHQIELSNADKGEKIACLEARKHLSWYLHGVSHSAYYKNRISSVSTMADVRQIVADITRELQ